MNQTESNQRILEIMNKEDVLSQEEIQLFKELISKCDLKIQNKEDWTLLMYILFFNKSQNLNLSEEQWNYLIKNSDLTQKNEYGYTALMYALKFNKTQYLNINEDQWDYLIKNSDLKQQNIYGLTPLIYALSNNKTQNLQITIKQFKTMYAALEEEQKQITFQKFIQENYENNQQYLEEINLLLYDLKFKSNEKTISWLKENNLQDILEMIEKRDMFFQLNKEVKLIDNHQKIDKIKL